MFKQLKKFTIQMVAGANVATIVVMFLVGYSDRLHPADFPILSNVGLGFPVLLIANLAFLIFWLLFKPRYVLIPFVGYLVCYVPIRKYTPFNVPQEVPDGAIKVLSFNTWGFGQGNVDDDGENPVIRYISDQDADIVCVQEAAYNPTTSAFLDSLIYPKYVYRDTTLHPNRGEILALYSKYPILSKERINYVSAGNQSVAYRLKIENDTVVLINNHLETTGLTLEEREQFKELVKGKLETNKAEQASRSVISRLSKSTQVRAPEAEAVARYIEWHKGESIILCGDFNDGPISYTHRTIAKNLTDCYVAAGNGPGISYHKAGFFVRIDNVMCSLDWEPYECKIDNEIKASDHYPIICYLKKRAKE